MVRARDGLARGARAAAVGALVVVAGCDDGGTLDPDYTVPTSVVIDPVAFHDDVTCSGAQGAMRSYVATVTDQTDAERPFTLPATAPVPCSQRVDFRFVVAEHRYMAEIDGYEQRADEIEPLGGAGSGSRHMIDRATGAEVKPRWRIACEPPRNADGEILPILEGSSRAIDNCRLLEDRGSTIETAILIDPTTALGGLRCAAADGGDIGTFDIRPLTAGLPAVLDVSCPPTEPIRYSACLVPGQGYQFRIEAEGPTGAWAALCQAEATEGVIVSAACAPLSSQGALSIPIGAVLQAAGLTCGAEGLSSYLAQIASTEDPPTIEPVQSNALPCDENARFAPLPPGLYQATVLRTGAEAGSPPIATCQGEVEPGATTVATCTAAP